MFVVCLLAAALLTAFGYQAFGDYLDARRFPPPGRLITVGAGLLHLHEQGDKGPVVVMESGLAASSLSWTLVQPKLAEFTRACSYDRAGFGWSSGLDRPKTLQDTVADLHGALEAAGLPAPYILIGHSFGGLLVRAFAHYYPGQIAGLVLVDPVSIAYWANCTAAERKRLALGAKLSRRGGWLAHIGVVRGALGLLLLGGRQLPRLIARVSAPQAGGLMTHLAGEVQKLPPFTWPMIRAHWSRPKAFAAMAATLEALPSSACEAAAMPIATEIPVVILSAASATPDELAERDGWAASNSHGKHIRTEGTGHWLQLERPDLIVDSVKSFLQE
ncbi:MAG: alpha/beta hydrolase [Bryobacteraceae bacterium]